jgi:hypothetical protein
VEHAERRRPHLRKRSERFGDDPGRDDYRIGIGQRERPELFRLLIRHHHLYARPAAIAARRGPGCGAPGAETVPSTSICQGGFTRLPVIQSVPHVSHNPRACLNLRQSTGWILEGHYLQFERFVPIAVCFLALLIKRVTSVSERLGTVCMTRIRCDTGCEVAFQG